MKSFRMHDRYDMRLHDEPLPLSSDFGSLLRVASVGICGSDLLRYSTAGTDETQLNKDLVLGHEFVAITENNQRVAVDPAIPCGLCKFCQSGNPNLFPNVIFAGQDRQDGALREYISWPDKCLYPLPDAISNIEGVMLEPLGVAIHAVDLAHLQIGMSIGVFGCGPIGLLIIQLARLSGAARIIATDILPHRVEAARSFEADGLLVEDEVNVNDFPYKDSLDVVFDASGSPGAVQTAFHAVLPGGKVILAGIPMKDVTFFTASQARRKGLTIKLVRRMKHTYSRAMDLVLHKKVDVHSIVTHHFPFEKTPEAFKLASRREGLKVIIDM